MGGGKVKFRPSSRPSWVFLTMFSRGWVFQPLLVDLTIEDGSRLKVLYGSMEGFHAIDVDSGSLYDVYIPPHTQGEPRGGSRPRVWAFRGSRRRTLTILIPTWIFSTWSRSDPTSHDRGVAQHFGPAAADVLRQRRRLRGHLWQNHQKRRPPMGRIAHLRGLHRHRTNHGLGQQGHRNQVDIAFLPRSRGKTRVHSV